VAGHGSLTAESDVPAQRSAARRNSENILFGLYEDVPHPDERRRGYTASYMETLLMTENGIEVLSKLPRTLTVIGGTP
jgi:hypothetical protein